MSRQRRAAHRSLTSLVAIAVAIQPLAASYAQVSADLNAPVSQRPVIDQAANGTPVVNIATPNANGVSHNIYQQFNISQKGAILNNNADLHQSQIAGLILGNQRITAGSEARLIVNEVSGLDRSSLAGYLEVAGPRTGVVIANPNGITCDGCGFVNMPRISLTTGRPSFDTAGNLQGFAVTGGDILVQGAGLDASRVDRLDLVARAVQINAAVHARDFFLSGGRQNYNYALGSGAAIADDGKGKPVFYLSSSALGGIYGDRIRIVGTETGLGIRAPKDMATSIGDMELLANGKLIIANASAAGRLTATSTNGEVEIEGAAYSDDETSVRATQALRLGTGAVLGAKNSVSVNAATLDIGAAVLAAGLNATGSLGATGGAVTLDVSGASSISAGGLLHGGDTLIFRGKGALTNAGVIQANSLVDLRSDTSVINSGKISGASDVALQAGVTLTNAASGQIAAGNDLQLSAAASHNLAGSISAGRDAVLAAPTMQLTQAITVTRNAQIATGALAQTGTLAIGGTGNLDVLGTLTIDTAGVIGVTGALDAKLGALVNRGVLVTDSRLRLESRSVSSGSLTNAPSGRIAAGAAATIKVAEFDNAGLLTANGDLLVAVQKLINAGQLASTSKLELEALEATNSGTISSAMLTAKLESFANESGGFFQASDRLSLNSAALTNRGQLVTTGQAELQIASLRNEVGSIVAQKNLSIGGRIGGSEAEAINLTSGQIASIDSDLSIKTTNLTVGGTLASGGDMALSIGRKADLLVAGSVQSGRDITLTAGDEINAHSSVRANRDIKFTAPVIQSSDIGAARDIIFSGASFLNQGALTALNDARLDFATSIENPLNKALNAGRELTIAAPLFTNAGVLAADGAVTLSGGTAGSSKGNHLNTETGQISAAFVASKDLAGLMNVGSIFATQLADLSGGSLINRNEIASDGGIAMNFTSIDNIGLIDGKTVSLIASDYVSNDNVVGNFHSSGGVIEARNALEIIAPDVFNTELIASGGLLRLGASEIRNENALIISRGHLTLEGMTAGARANLVHNFAGTLESTAGNVVLRAGTLENFGDGIVEHRVTKIGHQFITGQQPPSNLVHYRDLISDAGFFQLFDGGRTREFVWVPSPEMVDEILQLEGITIDQWTPTLWQKYAPNPASFDPTKWAIYVPDESRRAPAGSSIIATDERDVVVKPNTPGQILTDAGNIFIDAGLLHNRQSAISAVGDMVLTGGSVLNEGVPLFAHYALQASFNNGTLRGMGWSRNNGTGVTQWLPAGGGSALVRAESVGTVSSTITATGTLTGNLVGTFVNAGTPTTDPQDLSFADSIGGIIAFTKPGSVGSQPDASLGSAGGTGNGAPGAGSGSISNIPGISNALLKAFAPALDGSRFVIETRLPFINLDDYFGSDYFFSRLGFVPDEEIKILGDAYFDYLLIRDQILSQTGKRFLSPRTISELDEHRALIAAGADLVARLQIRPGTALSPEQQAALTEDVVIYETVQWAGQSALAPHLYLAQNSARTDESKAARVSARIVDIASAVLVNSNGTIEGSERLRVVTDRDIISTGGLFKGQAVEMTAGGAITLAPVLSATGNGSSRTGTIVGAMSKIEAGQSIRLQAPVVSIEGAQLLAEGPNSKIKIEAERLNIGPAEAFAREAYADGRLQYDVSRNLLLLSNIQSAGSIDITATDTAFIRAATLSAGDSIRIHAGELFITSGQVRSQDSGQLNKSGFTKSTTQWDHIALTQLPSVVDAGRYLELTSHVGDISITASILKGPTTAFQSAGQILINAAYDERYDSVSKQSGNLIITKSRSTGAQSNTVVPTEIYADDLSMLSKKGIVLQFNRSGDDGNPVSIDESIDRLSQFKGLAYLKELKDRPDVQYQGIEETFRNWNYRQVGLSGPAAAVIVLALTLVVPNPISLSQLGLSGLSGFSGALVTGSQVALNGLVKATATSFLTNGFDVRAALRSIGSDESLKALATTIVTAGLLEGFDQAGFMSSAPDTWLGRLQDGLVTSAGRSLVTTAINGESLTDNFLYQLRSAAVDTIGAQAASAMGKEYTSYKSDGNLSSSEYLGHKALHAALGCAMAEASASQCYRGAAEAAAGAIFVEQFMDVNQKAIELNQLVSSGSLDSRAAMAAMLKWQQQGISLSQLAGGLFAVALGAETADQVNTGASIVGNVAKNNYVESALDAASLALSLAELRVTLKSEDASKLDILLAGGAVAVDGVALALPFVPAGAGFLLKISKSGGRTAARVVNKKGLDVTDDVLDAARQSDQAEAGRIASSRTDMEAGSAPGARSSFEPNGKFDQIPEAKQVHIIDGGPSSATGAHYAHSTNVQIDYKSVKSDPETGVFQANVNIKDTSGNYVPKSNNGGRSTFWPDKWNSEEILSDVNSVSSKAPDNFFGDKLSDRGIWTTIKKEDGKVVAAYPRWPQ
jgi:filamentous hemagglutinin